MRLDPDEVFLATEMVALAKKISQAGSQPAQVFICYWTAFKNIYTALATRAEHQPAFNLRKNGTLITRRVGQLKIATVREPTESDLIALAFDHFSDATKHQLICHESTRFFANRTPTWRHMTIDRDAFGQRLNGVINVALTISARHPIWSPIEIEPYTQYMQKGGAKNQPGKLQDALARQVLDLLQTTHQNLLQGGKRQDSESDDALISQALPLLSIIVSQFLES